MIRSVVVVVTPDEGGGYVASAPGLPGCATHGDTVADAIANAREAVALYLDGEDAKSLAAAGATFDVIVATIEIPVAVPA